MPALSRRLGALLRRPATRPRGSLREDAPGIENMPRPGWMSEDAFRDFKKAYANSLAGRGRVVHVDRLQALFDDPQAYVRPAWMSRTAFDRFREARAQLLAGGGREMTVDELRAEFGLEAE